MKTKSLFTKRLALLAMAMSFGVMFAPRARAADPCCQITNVDSRSAIVTAQDRNTGHTFQFKASPNVLQKMKVGQRVFANFKTNQVSLNNAEPCCEITKSGGMAATRGVPNPNNGEPCCEITQI